MAKLTFLSLAYAQLYAIHGHPTGELQQRAGVDCLAKREITISTNARPTTSYSTAIETLQSVPVTVEPTLTGVRPISVFNRMSK